MFLSGPSTRGTRCVHQPARNRRLQRRVHSPDRGFRNTAHSSGILGTTADETVRARLLTLATVFGVAAVLSFGYMVHTGGGLLEVFSHPKAYLSAPSGYIQDLPMMAYPAIVLLAITLRSRKIRLSHIVLAFFFASPHLIMASLGGRRGPAFLVVCTLTISWYVAKNQMPSLPTVVGMIGGLGVLCSSFSQIAIISILVRKWTSTPRHSPTSVVENAGSSQEFIYSGGIMLTAEHFDRFYWGKRYLALFLVRPIPKQLWPTKYEDLGMNWMVTAPGLGGFEKLGVAPSCRFCT